MLGGSVRTDTDLIARMDDQTQRLTQLEASQAAKLAQLEASQTAKLDQLEASQTAIAVQLKAITALLLSQSSNASS